MVSTRYLNIKPLLLYLGIVLEIIHRIQRLRIKRIPQCSCSACRRGSYTGRRVSRKYQVKAKYRQSKLIKTGRMLEENNKSKVPKLLAGSRPWSNPLAKSVGIYMHPYNSKTSPVLENYCLQM